jgi:7-carboxy-7-deazaguanine synthase
MTAKGRAAIPRERRIRITEIYASVQGESTHVGKPCVFVRLTGCNLRCTWCDSEFTFTGGTVRDLDEVVAEASAFGLKTVEVTGGEPLLQPAVFPLMQRLLDAGHEVLLETSGSLDVSSVPDGVHIILDLKAPDSGEVEANLWANLEHLDGDDEIKIVVASRKDYEWARTVLAERPMPCTVLLSPAHGDIDGADLADWMVKDRLHARLQMQLHKVLWPADARGV